MKKSATIVLSLLISIIFVNITAQNLDDIMSKLSKSENAMHQILDKAMLNQQFNQSGDSAKISDLPSFIKKVEAMDIVIIEQAADSDTILIEELSNFNGGDKYESLVKVKDGDSDVHIVSQNKDNGANVYIIVINEKTLVMIKMTGDLSKNDIEDIVKEQLKKDE